MKTISLGSDHAGYLLKEKVKAHLQAQSYQILDFGTHDETSCDYPNYCRPAAESVASQESLYGIVFGGSGNGEAMVTNKVDNVRCTVCLWLDTRLFWSFQLLLHDSWQRRNRWNWSRDSVHHTDLNLYEMISTSKGTSHRDRCCWIWRGSSTGE